MVALLGVGLGAGLVAALLFGLVGAGAPLGVVLCYVAPLPIMIAGLGWHRRVALLAAWTGAFLLSLALRPSAGIAFAVGIGLPSWLLVVRTLCWHSVPGEPEGRWAGAGSLVLFASILGGAVSLVAAMTLGGGSYDTYADTLRRVTEAVLQAGPVLPSDPPGSVAGVPRASLVSFLLLVAPAVAASVFGLALLINLWLAGRTVALSGRLPRPLPSISDLRMPMAALWAIAAATLLGFGAGFLGVAGLALVGALTTGFAIQGLACLHRVTRGRPGRGPILFFAYVLTIFFGGTVVPLLALAGMVDTATPLRRRLSRRG